MQALVLCDKNKFELREIEAPVALADQVLVRVNAVGLCGTDFHIFEGHANYHTDERGQPIPLTTSAQILGHEFCGEIVDVGAQVGDLQNGDRVAIDQGISCSSRQRSTYCEYCETGNSHQCAEYAEHGITGLQGALAEYVAIPARNAVKISSPIPAHEAALTEPLGCIIHSSDTVQNVSARYSFGGDSRITNVMITGAGPAGLLFTQYLRRVLRFDGLIIVSEPDSTRRDLAGSFGATTLDPLSVDVVSAVTDLTHGERIHYLIEAAGVAQVFKEMPGLLRKQATVLLYGHGHHGVDLGVLNNIQFLEPTFVAPVGASGGFDADGRPEVYRRALRLLEEGTIEAHRIITHIYGQLGEVPQAFLSDHKANGFIKGVVQLT